MSIEHLSFAPMVRVGTALDFAVRDGYANNVNFIGTEADWTFEIEGWASEVWCSSKLEAVRAAQEMLFSQFAHRIDHFCKELVAAGKTSAALKLAELKGRWLASTPQQRKTLYVDELALVH
jgi:hypothetical protein